MPALGDVLSSPTVNGALCSVLGHDYALHAHRALHRADRPEEQGFHKVRTTSPTAPTTATSTPPRRTLHQDGQEGHGPHRHHRPRWAMIMYYPAGCTLEMAPTVNTSRPTCSARGLSLDRSIVLQAILPGGQYFSVDNSRWGQVAETYGHSIGLSEFKLTTPLRQGTAVLLHFDMFHRGTKRLEEDLDHPHRPMIKFQFFRTSEPTEPTWATTELTEDPFEYTGQAPYKQAIWEDIYREYINGLSPACLSDADRCHQTGWAGRRARQTPMKASTLVSSVRPCAMRPSPGSS